MLGFDDNVKLLSERVCNTSISLTLEVDKTKIVNHIIFYIMHICFSYDCQPCMLLATCYVFETLISFMLLLVLLVLKNSFW